MAPVPRRAVPWTATTESDEVGVFAAIRGIWYCTFVNSLVLVAAPDKNGRCRHLTRLDLSFPLDPLDLVYGPFATRA
jgi:hypothetical protein